MTDILVSRNQDRYPLRSTSAHLITINDKNTDLYLAWLFWNLWPFGDWIPSESPQHKDSVIPVDASKKYIYMRLHSPVPSPSTSRERRRREVYAFILLYLRNENIIAFTGMNFSARLVPAQPRFRRKRTAREIWGNDEEC